VHHKYKLRNPNRILPRNRILFLLALALGLSLLSGCSSRPKEATQPTQDTQSLVSSPFFSTYEFEIDEKNGCRYLLGEEYCSVLSVSFSEEYLAALERFKNDQFESILSDESGNPLYPDYEMSLYNYSGEPVSTIDLSVSSPSSFQPLLARTAMEVAVLSAQIDSGNGSVLGTITVFDVNGEKKASIAKIPLNQPMVNLTDFCADNDGNYYIVGENADSEQSISVISVSGDFLGMYPLDDKYPEVLLPSSNGIYFISKSYDKNNKCTTFATPISASSSSFGEEIVLPEFYNDCNEIFMKGDYIYGSDSVSMQAFSLKTQTMELVMAWNTIELSFMPYVLSVNSSGAVVAMGTKYGTDICEAAVLTPCLTDPNAGKTEIIVAGYEISSDETLLNAVKIFNQSHSDSRIVLRDYAKEYAFDSGDYMKDIVKLNQKMCLEFFSGDAPDICIDTENDVMGLAALATDTYLIDLYPYIKNDPDINLSQYFQNALFGYDTNGKLYMFPCGFFTRCFYGNPSVVGDSSSWKFSDFYALSDKLGSGTKILTDIPKMDLLQWTLETSMSTFVDLNSGRVSFDSGNFIDLLKWVDIYGSDVETYEIAPLDVINKKLALDLIWIDSPESFYLNYNLLKFVPTYMGYPNSSSDGLSFYSKYICAITTSCENPNLAWDFVRLFLQDDVQNALGAGFIPVSKEAAAKQVESTISLIEESGVDVSGLDDTFWNSYYDVLEKVDTPKGADYEVIGIVLEESAAFFAGQKTVEEVSELIQNRVQVYVNEQMN